MKKIFDTAHLDSKQKKVFFLNVFLPGLGFFYSLDWALALVFGILPVAFIGIGIKNILVNPKITALLWFLGIALHLVAIFISMKRKSPEKTSTITPLAYGIGTVIYLSYLMIQFFIQLFKTFFGNV